MRGVRVRLEKISKSFGRQRVLNEVSLEIKEREFFTILGPSGCGKTTLLNILAGLIRPDEGRVYFNEQDVTELSPHKRMIGMVFQDLALFPHMSVAENIAFGLRLRSYSEEEIRRRVRGMLELVRLSPSEVWNKYPSQLSGGQQQRVALARALAIEPKILLLDEPLSHVDYKIKQELLNELRRVHRETEVTTIFVTHDQNEAMFLSDRIAVMNFGRVEQVGTPEELYNSPASLFVANFFGDGNVLPGRFVNYDDDKVLFARLDSTIVMKEMPPKDGFIAYISGKIVDKVFMGSQVLLEVRIYDNYTVKAIVPRHDAPKYNIGDEVIIGFTEDAKIIHTHEASK